MTREDVKKIFPDATDEQISAMLGSHHKDVESKTKGLEDKLASYKEKADAYDKEQAEKLSAEEKLQALIQQAEATKLENQRILNRTKVIERFTAAGYKADTYENLLENLVADDEESSLKIADNFISALNNIAAVASAAAKQEAMQTPTPAPGVDGATSPALSAQTQYDAACKGGSMLEIIQAADALAAANKNGGK